MLGVVLLLLLIAKGVDKQKLLNRNLLLLLQIYFDFLNLSSTPTLQAIGKPFRAARTNVSVAGTMSVTK